MCILRHNIGLSSASYLIYSDHEIPQTGGVISTRLSDWAFSQGHNHGNSCCTIRATAVIIMDCVFCLVGWHETLSVTLLPLHFAATSADSYQRTIGLCFIHGAYWRGVDETWPLCCRQFLLSSRWVNASLTGVTYVFQVQSSGKMGSNSGQRSICIDRITESWNTDRNQIHLACSWTRIPLKRVIYQNYWIFSTYLQYVHMKADNASIITLFLQSQTHTLTHAQTKSYTWTSHSGSVSESHAWTHLHSDTNTLFNPSFFQLLT